MSCAGKVLPVLVLVLCLPQGASSGKVLLWPGEYSHWLSMKSIVEVLIAKGHEITVIIHTATPTIKSNQFPNCSFEVIPVPFTKQEVTDLMDKLLDYWMYDVPHSSFIQTFLKFKDLIDEMMEQNKACCQALFSNKDLLEKLRRTQYDVLLTDPMFLCGELLADILGVPFLISLRFSFASIMERQCGQMPAPPSYVPGVGIQYTDNMDFTQRLKNTLYYLFHGVVFNLFTSTQWDSFFAEIRGKPTTFCETMGKADIWLIRTYWDFEYPRPFPPNFKFVGGLHCKPAKPLPDDIEEFVQSSGDDGIVVFSLGSMIKNLTQERANTIAAALGQIPQKVLWRYSGEKPETLASNTRIYDWIPQNDLLGHPKTRAFITHGGTNGIYEAIYHGIPMVGIPLFADQPDNMMHMKTKGAAVTLDFNNMQSKDLVDGLNTVINDPTYKESAMKLSRIHHDQPMTPLDQAVFWIEFVMRNKGAKHLRLQAHNLTWYQYHCLDVFAALAATVALVIFITFKTCKFCFRKCCLRSKSKSKND
ncbi:UDP-glucuronosyltransferase 2B20-like isoform X4 [Megalops cyprinoides]|uniref:UDP-glucuronosyltransferase 2B20-like isoform X4 n=1 Tax=Megalops cyprinoides TaxID=118141 RepID=UPI00186409E9|nr:UDP-glucuronosyltransferase 2B20-like isoform X4 [Megalops cyprinoides]